MNESGNNIANKMAKSRKRPDKTHQVPRAISAAEGGSACVGKATMNEIIKPINE